MFFKHEKQKNIASFVRDRVIIHAWNKDCAIAREMQMQ